jgi:hypothetical protein
MSSNLQPPSNVYHLHHGDILLADITILEDMIESDILVRSGQYFATLATKLDQISIDLPKRQQAQKDELQKLIEELFYLQGRYKIKRKS